MDRGKFKAGPLRTISAENQGPAPILMKTTKRVNRHLTTVDQNAAAEKKVALKTTALQQNSTALQPSQTGGRRFIVFPKPIQAGVIDIDGEKSANYLNCPDLAPSQYAYLFKVEDKFLAPPNFLASTNINLLQRQRVIDWMTVLHGKFCDTQETLFIAVNYFDRYLASKPIQPAQLQTVAAAALYTASKFEEIYPIPIDDLCGVTEGLEGVELSPISLRKMEMDMLKMLRFRLNPPLKNHFLRRCSMAAGATVELHVLSKFLIEASMYDPDLATAVKPSLVAATASYVALTLFGERTRLWDKTMVFYSGYLEAEITPIVPRLAAIVRQLPTNTYHVTKKWAGIAANTKFTNWLSTA